MPPSSVYDRQVIATLSKEKHIVMYRRINVSPQPSEVATFESYTAKQGSTAGTTSQLACINAGLLNQNKGTNSKKRGGLATIKLSKSTQCADNQLSRDARPVMAANRQPLQVNAGTKHL